MNSSAATSNVSTLPTTAKAQTAKEVIAENIKLLIAQLEAGHSEGTSAVILSAIKTEQVASDPTEATTQPTTEATDAALVEVA